MVWGGLDPNRAQALVDGATYNPRTNVWSPINGAGAPSARAASAFWTCSEFVVWGGNQNGAPVFDGGRYDPATDSWTAIPEDPRFRPDGSSILGTGQEMIVWGGRNSPIYLGDGARYAIEDPV
jgi:hypothetical protein